MTQVCRIFPWAPTPCVKPKKHRNGVQCGQGPTQIPFSTVQAIRQAYKDGQRIPAICAQFQISGDYTRALIFGGIRERK